MVDTSEVDGGKPSRFSGPFRAERVFMFTQAKAWAEVFLALRAASEDSEEAPALLKDSAARSAMKA